MLEQIWLDATRDLNRRDLTLHCVPLFTPEAEKEAFDVFPQVTKNRGVISGDGFAACVLINELLVMNWIQDKSAATL